MVPFDAMFLAPQGNALLGVMTIARATDAVGAEIFAANYYRTVGTPLQAPVYGFKTIHGLSYVASNGMFRIRGGIDVSVQLLFALFSRHTFLFAGIVYVPAQPSLAQAAAQVVAQRDVNDCLGSIVFAP